MVTHQCQCAFFFWWDTLRHVSHLKLSNWHPDSQQHLLPTVQLSQTKGTVLFYPALRPPAIACLFCLSELPPFSFGSVSFVPSLGVTTSAKPYTAAFSPHSLQHNGCRSGTFLVSSSYKAASYWVFETPGGHFEKTSPLLVFDVFLDYTEKVKVKCNQDIRWLVYHKTFCGFIHALHSFQSFFLFWIISAIIY